MMHALQVGRLDRWRGPPLLLVRPKISHLDWFTMSHTEEMIEAGYSATVEALLQAPRALAYGEGIFPKHEVLLKVDKAACVGCTLCATMSGGLMKMNREGKAFPVQSVVHWSGADGDFVRHCPTNAITASHLDDHDTANEDAASPPTESTTSWNAWAD
jgi:NTE family protein